MPDPTTLLLFITAALSLNLTPGPDMLYVMARSIGQGRRAGLVSALGLSIGYVVHTLAAASGLAALLLSAPLAFHLIRVLGAVYLAYLGLRTLLGRGTAGQTPPADAAAPPPPETSLGHIFRQGALTSTLNPSIAVFFLAFLPQFVQPTQGAVFAQIVVLGLVFNTTATTTHATIALLTGTAGDRLRQRRGSARYLRWFTGIMLIALGVRMLLSGLGG